MLLPFSSSSAFFTFNVMLTSLVALFCRVINKNPPMFFLSRQHGLFYSNALKAEDPWPSGQDNFRELEAFPEIFEKVSK